MLDLKTVRENPDLVRESQRRRFEDPRIVDRVLELDERIRALKTETEGLRAERNRVSGLVPKTKDAAEKQQMIAAMRQVGDRIAALENELKELDQRLLDIMLRIPNIPDPSVHTGKDDSE